MTDEETSSPVLVEVTDGVAHLTLARPNSSNALDLETARALRSALRQLCDDGDVRAVVVTGQGKRFCGGGDLKAMLAAEDRLAYIKELACELHLAFQELSNLPIPVVAGVHGAVAGAGVALMLSCDVVLAADPTAFAAAYPGVGLTPDCGLSWLLPRAVGQPRALSFLLLNQRLSAQDAHAWGMVNELVEPSTLIHRCSEVARELASGPAWALGQTKALVRSAATQPRDVVGFREADLVTDAADRPEARARMEGFLTR